MPEPTSDKQAPSNALRVHVVGANELSRAVLAVAGDVGLTGSAVDGAAIDIAALDEQDAVVICDHDEESVAALLPAVLPSAAGYVGMVGSRSRAAGLRESLPAQGVPADALARLHCPIGLNLGGRDAGHIALSIVAEVVAAGNDRLDTLR